MIVHRFHGWAAATRQLDGRTGTSSANRHAV